MYVYVLVHILVNKGFPTLLKYWNTIIIKSFIYAHAHIHINACQNKTPYGVRAFPHFIKVRKLSPNIILSLYIYCDNLVNTK